MEITNIPQPYLTFVIGGDVFAVSLPKVKEIIEYGVVTKVPKMPEWVRGVINLRGNVVPVIDLAVKFRQPVCETGKHTCIVIAELACEGETTVMGIVADSVKDVVDWQASEIRTPPVFGTRMKTDYLIGMAPIGNAFCLILDVDKVLSIDELLELPGQAETEAEISIETLEASDIAEFPV